MSVWRNDPDLADKFHPDYPDDVQVIVHEGSYRFTDAKPEVMWARIFAKLGWTHNTGEEGYAYKAQLLNQPHQLKTVKLGDEILLVGHAGYQYTIRVTHEYITERDFYTIRPCDKCNLPELFDPISKLMEKVFPDMPKETEDGGPVYPMFSSFCPVCGGVMVVRHKHLDNLPKDGES